MMKLPFCFELSKCVSHTNDNFRLDIKRMMCREHPLYRKLCNFFKRLQVSLRVSGREPRREPILIHQIACIEITFFFLPKAHMTGRVPRCMQDFYASPSKDLCTRLRVTPWKVFPKKAHKNLHRSRLANHNGTVAENCRSANSIPLRVRKNRDNPCVRQYDPNECVWQRL